MKTGCLFSLVVFYVLSPPSVSDFCSILIAFRTFYWSRSARDTTHRFVQTMVLLFLSPLRKAFGCCQVPCALFYLFFSRYLVYWGYVCFMQGATNKDVKNIVTPSNDDNLVDSQKQAANRPQVVCRGQTALFKTKTPSNELPHRVFRDKRNSLLSSKVTRFVIKRAFAFLLLPLLVYLFLWTCMIPDAGERFQ